MIFIYYEIFILNIIGQIKTLWLIPRSSVACLGFTLLFLLSGKNALKKIGKQLLEKANYAAHKCLLVCICICVGNFLDLISCVPHSFKMLYSMWWADNESCLSHSLCCCLLSIELLLKFFFEEPHNFLDLISCVPHSFKMLYS